MNTIAVYCTCLEPKIVLYDAAVFGVFFSVDDSWMAIYCRESQSRRLKRNQQPVQMQLHRLFRSKHIYYDYALSTAGITQLNKRGHSIFYREPLNHYLTKTCVTVSSAVLQWSLGYHYGRRLRTHSINTRFHPLILRDKSPLTNVSRQEEIQKMSTDKNIYLFSALLSKQTIELNSTYGSVLSFINCSKIYIYFFHSFIHLFVSDQWSIVHTIQVR